ncbi:MAG: mannose-1-phosphate guanylyltransferase [Planctomycetota bacterium]|nr:mannose-1-phosphate guanylyltransferase [Planctomycetota bacterium]
MKYAFIMAGGSGTRYWPKSRKNTPKHLIPFGEIGVLLERTIERLLPFYKKENIFVVSARQQEEVCREFTKELPAENLILEPIGMDSAPCVALSAAIAQRLNDDAVVTMFPADHLIYPQDAFLRTVQKANEVAAEGKHLVTIGVRPTRPATEYGYIHRGQNIEPGVYSVTEFREKPPLEVARNYFESGEYYWNCGIFVWKAARILDELHKFLPNTWEKVTKIAQRWGTDDFESAFSNHFPQTDSISIDYAVMEKTGDAVICEAEFQWDDVGNWLALERHMSCDKNGNLITGSVVELNAENSIICGEGGRLVGAVGVKDLVIVDTPDALLVMPKERASEIKTFIEKLKKEGYERYL